MTLKKIVRIKTTDTKKTYDFPDDESPRLWAVRLDIEAVSRDGYYRFTSSFPRKTEIFLERSTLENAGLLPMRADKENKTEKPTETAEDLIMRLLGTLGFYPTE